MTINELIELLDVLNEYVTAIIIGICIAAIVGLLRKKIVNAIKEQLQLVKKSKEEIKERRKRFLYYGAVLIGCIILTLLFFIALFEFAL